MSKQSSISSVLAAAASLLVVGLVVVGSPASAASEEDLAAPKGSFVSTMAVPVERNNIVYVAQDSRPSAILTISEEDAAVPQGAFTSAMTAPDIEGEISVANNSAKQTFAGVNLSEVVAAGLE